MGKDKLRRFALMKDFPHVLESNYGEAFGMKGKWRTDFFKNEHPIVLELGCGKGEYTVGLARHYQKCNFIGVDIKGSRMFIGARDASESGLDNVGFLRTRIEWITNCFDAAEVDEIWLTFSDPQPKKPRKRLTSPEFLTRYKSILKPAGKIHVKTDSNLLFESTEEVLKALELPVEYLTWDLYNQLPEHSDAKMNDILHIQTHYERLFTSRGSTIKYARFRLD
jgi:tRNA (guanine-N7-)-methyltransferase